MVATLKHVRVKVVSSGGADSASESFTLHVTLLVECPVHLLAYTPNLSGVAIDTLPGSERGSTSSP